MGKQLIALALVTAFAQPKVSVVIGNAATRAFVFQGKPIHPFCVDFPLERSSRSQPHELAKCTDTRVTPKAAPAGFLSAEYSTEPGERFVSFAPYASYRVLARKGDRFFVATEKSGGGSGQFTELFWVRLGEREIAIVKDETGGDRCLGGLGAYQVSSGRVAFSQSQSAQGLVGVSGVNVPPALVDALRSSYSDCDGSALYRYDLNTERMELRGVQLGDTEPPDAADKSPQACFDRLSIAYRKSARGRLSLEQTKRFAREFVSSCSRP